MTYYALDIETTGLNVKEDLILEVAIIRDDGDPIPNLARLHLIVGHENVHGHIRALLMHAKNGLLAACEDFLDEKDVLRPGYTFPSYLISTINQWIGPDRATFAGKNVGSFDLPFLDHHPIIHGGSRMMPRAHRCIDVGSLWMGPNLIVPSLPECLARAGVSLLDDHRAMTGALSVVHCVRKRFENK